MNVGHVFQLLVAAVVLALGLSVAPTNPVAAACLVQYAILTVLEYDSKRFRTLIEGHERVLSLVKVGLLLVALVLLL